MRADSTGATGSRSPRPSDRSVQEITRKLILLLLRRKRNLSLAAGAVIPMAAFSKRLMGIPEQPSRGDHARFFSRIRSAKRLKR
jgi:hypothetical protein